MDRAQTGKKGRLGGRGGVEEEEEVSAVLKLFKQSVFFQRPFPVLCCCFFSFFFSVFAKHWGTFVPLIPAQKDKVSSLEHQDSQLMGEKKKRKEKNKKKWGSISPHTLPAMATRHTLLTFKR